MNYAVRWRPFAERQLLVLYIRAADKDLFTAYSEGVDRILARDPLEQGEERATPAERLWFYRPLCVVFRVDEAARVVYVLAVKWVGR